MTLHGKDLSAETASDWQEITVQELRRRFDSPQELAVVDVRDGASHSYDGHILRSAFLPLNDLELRVADLIPRLATDIVVYDAGDGVFARRAVQRLRALGYRSVALLSGGVGAWRDAGFEVFTGSHVIGKAFGEFVEHVYGTPHLSVREVKERIEAGENIVLLDSRPEAEFLSFSIAGAIDAPGAELVYRFPTAVKDPDALVVVNCAGRTRSIIGAQALINAGVRNRVVSLANGTMDWLIEGFSLQSGTRNLAPEPEEADAEAAQDTVDRLARRFDLRFIDRSSLDGFRRDAIDGTRTLYVLDVRTREEFEAGHVPGSRSAPGGQLVQQSWDWIGTQNSRVVLVDNHHGVRAAITASWLTQINVTEVYILRDALAGAVETGPEPRRLAAAPPGVETVAVTDLRDRLAGNAATVLDLAPWRDYHSGHIPGSRFALRSRLRDSLDAIGGDGPLVLASADGALAAFAAAEIVGETERAVLVLSGGTSAWRVSGLPLATDITDPVHPFDDAPLNPYEAEDTHAAFREYLAWEIGLVEQLERDGTTRFRVFPEPDSESEIGTGAN